jgi:DNA-directed RNA polymerase sigma subunit (sigma70/sigma32)
MRLNLCLIFDTQGFNMTLDEIAEALGISHQRVSQLEQSALRKIRIALKNLDITIEDLQSCLKYY